jgi:hypothetical protein
VEAVDRVAASVRADLADTISQMDGSPERHDRRIARPPADWMTCDRGHGHQESRSSLMTNPQVSATPYRTEQTAAPITEVTAPGREIRVRWDPPRNSVIFARAR